MRATLIITIVLGVAAVLWWGQFADGAALTRGFPDVAPAEAASASRDRAADPAPSKAPSGSRLTGPTALVLGLTGLGLVVFLRRRLRI